MSLFLRDYQTDAVARVRECWTRGDLGVIAQAATGMGKTVIGIALLRAEMLDDTGRINGLRAIWIAHRDELLTQPLEAMRQWFPEASTGLVKAGVREYDREIVVASIQSLHRGRLPEVPAFDLAIVDESHHAELKYRKARDADDKPTGEIEVVGNTYGVLLTHLRRLNPRLRLLGLTATPYRADARGLGGCFPGRYGPDGLPAKTVKHGAAAFSYDIAFGIRNGWLSPVRGMRIETGTNLGAIKVRAGDFVTADLAKACNTEHRNHMVVEAWLEHAKGRPTIAFCVDVGLEPGATPPTDEDGNPQGPQSPGHVFTLAGAFRAAGVRTEPVWGGMERERRRDVLRRFKAGEIEVVANCGIMTEGTDLPSTACIVMARPTKSTGLYVQMLGRGVRIADGKTDCLVLDCADVARTAGAIRTLADLAIPGAVDHQTGDVLETPKLCKRKGCENYGLDEFGGFCSDACRRRGTQVQIIDEHGRVDWHAVEFDLFTGDLSWGRIGAVRVLGLGDGRSVVVFPDGDGHRAFVADRKARAVEWLTWGIASEAEALADAERMVRRSGAHGRNFVKHAGSRSWHARQGVTERQEALLVRRFGFGQEVRSWSMAQAALVLDWAFARETVMLVEGGEKPNAWRLQRFADDYRRLTAERRVA